MIDPATLVLIEAFTYILFFAVLWGAIAEYIASQKGRKGFWWGFFLGFFGIIIVAIQTAALPDKKA